MPNNGKQMKLDQLQSAARNAPELLAGGIADIVAERDRLLADNARLRSALDGMIEWAQLMGTRDDNSRLMQARAAIKEGVK